MDIIMRAAGLFDKLVIAVAANNSKGPLFNHEERFNLVQQVIDMNPELKAKAEVRPMDTLLVDFVEKVGAKSIIRGLRAVSDFEFEFQMAGMNTRLNSQIETIFLMSSEGCQFISSRFVKEIAALKGDVSQFVPATIFQQLIKKLDN